MKNPTPDHYAVLGLHRNCTAAQIRTAYRTLAKRHHPDLHGQTPEAQFHTQQINAAYEILSEATTRQAYDAELAAPQKTSTARPSTKLQRNFSQDVSLRLEDFLRGTKLEVRVNDPGNPDGLENYELTVPPETAPGTRCKITRAGFFEGGVVQVRLKARPDFRFKIRGADLRCDLKINFSRAQTGGIESVRGVTGNFLRVTIPKNVARGEIIILANEGLPKPRGGRGDLQVRILYAPAVQIRRSSR